MNMHRHQQPHHQHNQHHGIQKDSRGQDQPVDKSRAQHVSLAEEAHEKSERDAPSTDPFSTGEPASVE
jgi:hypothetical protein